MKVSLSSDLNSEVTQVNSSGKSYLVLFIAIFVTIFFSDFILIKQAGILGQVSIIFSFLYCMLFLYYVLRKKESIRINGIFLAFVFFVLVLIAGLLFSNLNYFEVFKNEMPLIKFGKQLFNVIIWGALFFIMVHYLKNSNSMSFNSSIKFALIYFILIVFIGLVEWLLYVINPGLQIGFSKVYHFFFVIPYKNVYTWLVGFPRYRLVEGEPVHASFAMEFFFIIFTIGFLKSKYRIQSLLSLILIIILGFLTFSRSAYLGFWLITAVFTIYLFFFDKKYSFLKTTRTIFLLLFVFQSVITFPFLNDSIYKYYQEKFAVQLQENNQQNQQQGKINVTPPKDENINVAQEEMSNNTRAISMLISFDMLKKNPLLGVGWGLYGFNFEQYFQKYYNMAKENYEFKMYLDKNNEYFWPEQHSLLLRIISESGGLGLLAILAIFILYSRPVIYHLKNFKVSRDSCIILLVYSMSMVIVAQFLFVMSGLNLLYIPLMLGLTYYLINKKNLQF